MNRSYSLKKNKSFRYVYRRGKTLGYDSLSICYVMKRTPGLQVGFSVSKKIGKAVVRNRVKRRLKEAFSQYLNEIKPNALVVIVARPGIEKKDFVATKKNLERLLQKAKLFKETR
ncbi:MAG: ribonuclease P protein component [Eubacteriales bacterium]